MSRGNLNAEGKENEASEVESEGKTGDRHGGSEREGSLHGRVSPNQMVSSGLVIFLSRRSITRSPCRFPFLQVMMGHKEKGT